MGKIPFGVGFLGESDINEIIENAKAAEEFGFSNCWIAEDYFCGGAFSIASACACNTKDIGISIGVINPYTRHPALCAMEIAALNKISGNRVQVAMGSSNKLWIEQQMGIPFIKAKTSLKEAVEIIRHFGDGECVNYDGEMFHTRNVVPRAPAFHDVPLLLGVKSAQMLQMAGKTADGVLLSVGTSIPYVKWVKEQIKIGADRVGRDLSGFKIAAYLLISIDKDREYARNRVKSKIAYYLGLHGVHDITLKAGIDPEKLTLFKEGFIKGEYRTDLVSEDIIDMMSVSGEPDECAEKLRALVEAGVTEPIMFQIPEIPVKENLMQVKKYILQGENAT